MGDDAAKYDVFLSYNTRDHASVERVAETLHERGIKSFLDRWSLKPGLPWPQALERALARSAAVAVFIGPDGMGAWQHREQFLALDRQGRDKSFPVIPVLLRGSEPPLGFLRLNMWVDLRQRDDDPHGLAILEAAIRRQPPAADAEEMIRQTVQRICPYRGLQAFREEDAALFFGRKKATEDLIAAVGEQSIVAVIGSSGSGKSSLVRAGLVPYLRAAVGDHGWEIATIKPGEEPLHALMEVLSPPAEDLSRAQRLAHIEADVRALRDRGFPSLSAGGCESASMCSMQWRSQKRRRARQHGFERIWRSPFMPRQHRCSQLFIRAIISLQTSEPTSNALRSAVTSSYSESRGKTVSVPPWSSGTTLPMSNA